MKRDIEVREVGDSVGIVLTPAMLEKLKVRLGDMLYAYETANGIELRPDYDEFAAQMSVAEKIMSQDYDLLRRLAES